MGETFEKAFIDSLAVQNMMAKINYLVQTKQNAGESPEKIAKDLSEYLAKLSSRIYLLKEE